MKEDRLGAVTLYLIQIPKHKEIDGEKSCLFSFQSEAAGDELCIAACADLQVRNR